MKKAVRNSDMLRTRCLAVFPIFVCATLLIMTATAIDVQSQKRNLRSVTSAENCSSSGLKIYKNRWQQVLNCCSESNVSRNGEFKRKTQFCDLDCNDYFSFANQYIWTCFTDIKIKCTLVHEGKVIRRYGVNPKTHSVAALTRFLILLNTWIKQITRAHFPWSNHY